MQKLNKSIVKVFSFFSIFFSFFLTMPAFADLGEITQAATRTDDQSRQALITIFGDVVQNPLSGGGGAGTILSSLFGVANGALLVIGGFAVVYFFFKKITQTAHDGSVYSQSQHTVWGPLRLLFGVAALAPTANGWSLAQLMMLWAASVMGVGSANLATDAAISSLAAGQSMVVQPAMASTTELAKNLYKIDLCMHGINAGLTQAQNAGALMPENAFIQQSPTMRGFVLKNQSFTCGGANLAMSAAQPATMGVTTTFISATIDATSIYQAHQQALQQMQTTIAADSLAFVNAVVTKQNGGGGTLPDSSAQIKAAALQYENTVQASVVGKQGEIADLASKVSDSIKTNGWWMLGSWYQTFAQANTRLSDAVQGKASTFSASGGDPGSTNVVDAAMNAFQTQQALSAAATTNALGTDPENPPQNSTSSQIIDSIFSGQSLVNWVVNSRNVGQVNPLIQMKNFGDNILGTAEIALGTYTAFGVADEVARGKSAVGVGVAAVNFFTSVDDAASGVFGALKPFIIAVIIALFMIGASLSIYLPMIPFIVWFGAIINWLVVVGEAIIAAPLWALTHLAGEGEGMGSRSAHGWIFLLNVMVRPLLMVIGFFLAGAAIVAAGTVLNAMFGTAVANVQYDSTTGLISIVTLLVLYASMSINLVHTCFNLILIVPDQVINWVGGHAAPNIGRDDSAKTGQAISGFSQKLDHLMPKPTTRVDSRNNSGSSNEGNGLKKPD